MRFASCGSADFCTSVPFPGALIISVATCPFACSNILSNHIWRSPAQPGEEPAECRIVCVNRSGGEARIALLSGRDFIVALTRWLVNVNCHLKCAEGNSSIERPSSPLGRVKTIAGRRRLSWRLSSIRLLNLLPRLRTLRSLCLHTEF